MGIQCGPKTMCEPLFCLPKLHLLQLCNTQRGAKSKNKQFQMTPFNHFICLWIGDYMDREKTIVWSCFVGPQEQLKAESDQRNTSQVQQEDYSRIKN